MNVIKVVFMSNIIINVSIITLIKSLEITEDGVGGVSGDLVLGGITDQTLRTSESNIRRRRPISLVIHYYLYMIMLPHCHARVRRSQINPYCRALSLVRHCRRQREAQRLFL